MKIMIFVIFFSILYEGCSSSQYLKDCNNVLTSNKNEYFDIDLIYYPELKNEQIKEEVKKDSVMNWVKNYYGSDKISKNFYYNYWERIKNKIKKLDKIFYYSTIDIYGGQEGLVIIRDCQIVYDMNLLDVTY